MALKRRPIRFRARRLVPTLAPLFVTASLGVRLVAAAEMQTLRVVVVSTSGRSVFLDRGRSDGISPGMSVRLFYPQDSATPIVAPVVSVSGGSARVDLPIGVESPPIGTFGEIDVQATPGTPPPQAPETPAPAREVPAHPEWKRDLSGVSPDAPLLAPVERMKPEERPTTLSGRIYFNSLFTHDGGSGRNNDSYSGRLGTTMTVTNPVGLGGRLRFDAEALTHQGWGASVDSYSEFEWGIELLSYAIGGNEYSPYRLEVGRFYSVYLPELGLIDGAETALQFDGGFTLGVGGGMLPRNNESRDWDGDVGAHVFVSYASETPGVAAAVLGYQHTWHDGDDDRDQIVARINLHPVDQVWLYGFVRTDLYGSDDELKSDSIEFTEAWAQIRYSPVSWFAGTVSYSHYQYPELLEADYRYLPVDIIENGAVDRLRFSTWISLSKTVRLTTDFGLWSDQNDDGSNGEASVEWAEPDWPTLRAAVFYTDGSFNSGQGFRIDARHQIGAVDASLGYELFHFDGNVGSTGDYSYLRNVIRGGVSVALGKWYMSLNGDYYFGDVDALFTAGVYISRRF